MQIDWITVAAQIVNFLVLVWLLQRFLYGPITRAMNRREQRIEDRLNEAEETRAEAGREAEALRRKRRELENERGELLEEARREAKELREKLEREAREDVQRRRRSWHDAVAEEREEFLRELRLHTARHVYGLARSALAGLAGAEVEAQAAERFAERLSELDEEHAATIAEAAREEGNAVLVESSFELSEAAWERIGKAVHETISEELEIRHGRSEDLLFGIRLMAGGRTVEWSLARYLERLEDAVEDKLAQAQTKEREAA
ncbi:MAG: F0F1 ATP synthase subunit B [Alphaproteobacteria bacterium]